MKVWRGYGSEHSMNLVMIGQFKDVNDAKKVKEVIDHLTEKLTDKIEIGSTRDQYSDDMLSLLKEVNIYTLRPLELEQFLYETHTEVEEDKLILTTNESEVSAFIKLMVGRGAKIEIFSAHDYPNAKYGRGK